MTSIQRNPLRRSCHFCRSRKAKCSGESRCEACRKQKIECIYHVESPRVRTTSDQHSKRESSSPQSGSPIQARILSHGSAILPLPDLASQLEILFQQNSACRGTTKSPESIPPIQNSQVTTSPASLLIPDLVGLLTTNLGSLGSQHLDDNTRFRPIISYNKCDTMFDNVEVKSNPLAEYDIRKQKQLIDVWYSAHPLRVVVSKTLFLRDLRNKAQDDVLLAVILAEAIFLMGNTFSADEGHTLLNWAILQLRGRMHGRELPTVQSLVLLGWNAFCSGAVDRALCFFEIAKESILEIKRTMLDHKASSRINGIDIADVETELVSNLWWITFSFSIWASIQSGEQLPNILPSAAISRLFPVASASSTAMRLDEISENLSTLQIQKESAQEMWPLACICSIIANIFSAQPHEVSYNTGASNIPWESNMLEALHRAGSSREYNTKVGSTKTHQIVMDGIEALVSEAENNASKDALFTAHHALAIHSLFPRGGAAGNYTSSSGVQLTADTLERLLSSISALVDVFDVERGRSTLDRNGRIQFCTYQYIYAQALDTCTRALDFVQLAAGVDVSLNSIQLVHIHAEKLSMLTSRLLDNARHQAHYRGIEFREFKKKLKGQQLYFNQMLTESLICSSQARQNFQPHRGEPLTLLTTDVINHIPRQKRCYATSTGVLTPNSVEVMSPERSPKRLRMSRPSSCYDSPISQSPDQLLNNWPVPVFSPIDMTNMMPSNQELPYLAQQWSTTLPEGPQFVGGFM